jgi:subtilase family serine protease
MRGVPDVALSSASHDGYMVYENGSHWILSGTSAAAPAFAGVMALVVERTGGLGQGSANAELYSLVNADRNPFHATQSGNNSVPGVAGFWANGAAYNLATGLGSVDGAALAGIWDSGSGAPPTLNLTAASNVVSVTAGGSATMSFSAITRGSFAGDIRLSMGGLRPGLTAVWSANPITPTSSVSTNAVTLTVMASPQAAQGNYSFMVTAAGDSLVSTQSVTVQVQKLRACFGLLRPLRLPCGAPVPVRLPIPKMERLREDQ